jgi:uncharacterized protein YjbI with pentapeptide repeats
MNLDSPEGLARWRESHPGRQPQFIGHDFAGRNFRGYDLRGITFVRCILNDCDFREALVTSCGFFESQLWGASFAGTDLSLTNFSDANCRRADFSRATLAGATMQRAQLHETQFVETNLRGADLTSAILHLADLSQADFSGADLSFAQVVGCNARGADFTGASLEVAVLVNCDLTGATIVGSRVFGISAWEIELANARQKDIIITRPSDPAITCDDVEIAQFIYLLLENEKIRKIIDGVTSKVVLILGRFTEERKAVLDALRDALRRYDLTPVLFDFEKPRSKDITGTVETLARMARFIIADLTHPSSIPHELATLVPHLRSTPIVPIQLEGTAPYAMFEDWAASYRWVLERKTYTDTPSLIASLPEILAPAQNWRSALK